MYEGKTNYMILIQPGTRDGDRPGEAGQGTAPEVRRHKQVYKVSHYSLSLFLIGSVTSLLTLISIGWLVVGGLIGQSVIIS